MKTIHDLVRGKMAMLEPTVKEAKHGKGEVEVLVLDIIAGHGINFLVSEEGEPNLKTVASYRIKFKGDA